MPDTYASVVVVKEWAVANPIVIVVDTLVTLLPVLLA